MRTPLIADDGKIYTDGEIYGTEILLEEGRSADDFHQITMEEYMCMREERESSFAEDVE